MRHFVLNLCVHCDVESFARVPGFLQYSAQERL